MRRRNGRHLGEVDSLELLDEAPHEVAARLLAVGDDVDAGVLLIAKRQGHRVAHALLEGGAVEEPRSPEGLGRGEPRGLGQTAGDGGLEHVRPHVIMAP